MLDEYTQSQGPEQRTWRALGVAWKAVGNARRAVAGVSFAPRNVALILGSSRGGTTLLHTLLSHHQNVVSLDGEHTPFYKLVGLTYPRLRSDRVEPDYPLARRQLLRLIAAFVARPCDDLSVDDWIDRFLLRLPLQSCDRFHYHEIRHRLAGARSEAELVARLNAVLRYYGLDTVYYDCDSVFVNERPRAAPAPRFETVEEPPYVLPGLYRTTPSDADLDTKVVVLKASVDAYRIAWLTRLFSDSRLTFIHEVRQPADSINGLMDGWRTTRGFYSHRVGGLSISGYSERHPLHRDLWCFDLPPNWEAQRNESLEFVCANQWAQAHRHILDSLPGERVFRIRFEDLTASADRRRCVIDRLCGLLGIGDGGALFRRTVSRMPVVMATELPHANRWKRREGKIADAIRRIDPDLIRELDEGGTWT